MQVRHFVTKVAVVSTLAILAIPAQATHSWSIFHWARTANPMPLEVVDSVTSDWQTEFDDSIIDWNDSVVLDMPVSAGSTASKDRKRCKADAGKMRVCNASYGRSGWLGMASINLDSNSHITKGVAKLNDSYSSYWGAYPDEMYSVMCQEIGHVFGLHHTSTNGNDDNTCMDYSDDTSPDPPNEHDYNQLETIYGHLDTYNSYAGGSDDGSDDGGDGGGGGGGCNAPPGKGCNKNNGRDSAGEVPPMGIRVRGNSRSEVWVASDNRGGYWVHFLILAPQD